MCCNHSYAQTQNVAWGVDSPTLVLAGVFSITNPDTSISDNGFQLAEAFKAAIQQVNNANILPGIPVIGVIGDDVGDAVKAAAFGNTWMQDAYLYPFIFSASNPANLISLNTNLSHAEYKNSTTSNLHFSFKFCIYCFFCFFIYFSSLVGFTAATSGD